VASVIILLALLFLVDVVVVANVLSEMVLAFETVLPLIFLAVFAWKTFSILLVSALMPLVRIQPTEHLLTTLMLAYQRGMTRFRDMKI
jgi:hypothetical protein